MVNIGDKKFMSETHPLLAKEWDTERNLPALPESTSAGSNKKFWWICELGHSWEAQALSRKNGTGCPFCSNNRILKGFNDLATTHPVLSMSWNSSRNFPVTPEEVFAGTQRKFWWSCELGHEWQATVGSRKSGTGCPVCANLTILAGFNDLATTHPEVAATWHPKMNHPVSVSSIGAGGRQKYWWLCPQGHEYRSLPRNRSLGRGCPICAGKTVLVGETDFETKYYDIAESWHPTKNLPAVASEVASGSSRKYWWICKLNHEWEAPVSARTTKKSGCPVCSGQSVQIGFNDLLTTDPLVAKTWDVLKNKPHEVNQITRGSTKRRWWICDLGHSWQAAPYTRTNGIGCPFCSGRSVLAGFNDLQTSHPELAKSWHPSKNLPANVTNVSAGTPVKYWWICDLGHEWQTAPAARSKGGTGCPRCANYGFDATRPAFLYFIRHENLKARKIGIMNSESTRLNRFEEKGWVILGKWAFESGGVARDVETALLNWIRRDLNLPAFLDLETMGAQGGHSETFSLDGPGDDQVLATISRQVNLALAHSSS